MDHDRLVVPEGNRGHQQPEERACESKETFGPVAGHPDPPPEADCRGGSCSVEKASTCCRLGSKEGRSGKGLLNRKPARERAELHASHPVESSELRPGSEFSFRLWASSLIRRVLKSGTCFGYFVSSALTLCRDSSLPVATALFPLPLPSSLATGRSCKRRRTLAQHVNVVLFVLVLGLNFLHSGGRPVPGECLQRPPSAAQASALNRLRELVGACARLGGSELQPGRKGLQLAARHAEVLSFLRAAGLQEDSYLERPLSTHADAFVPHLPGGPEELKPYRDLDANRVALSGNGSWDIAAHLDPDLLLPFLEPRALQCFEPSSAPGPSFKHERESEVMGLFRKWDGLGLLHLVPGPLEETRLTRIFGAYKDHGRDRQIGDRRHMNNREARIADGPSRRLPAGPQLVRLTCPRWTHGLYGSIVDRKDFYHQAAVSLQRASCNAVAPVFRLKDFLGTQAYVDFLAAADLACAEACRGTSSFLPSAVLVDTNPPVHGAFRSLLQGDHAGVEMACSGHEGLLRAAGILGDPPGGRLLNKCPVSVAGPWTGLIIDDLFCVSCEQLRPGGDGPPVAASERLLRQAKKAYAAEGVVGSDAKDQFSQRVFCAAGAQIDASAPTVSAGLVLVGLPAHRRLALAHASLTVAAERYISEELASILAGSWVTALLYRRCLMAAIGPLFSLGKRVSQVGGSLLRPLPSPARQDLVLLSALAPAMVSNVAAPMADGRPERLVHQARGCTSP